MEEFINFSNLNRYITEQKRLGFTDDSIKNQEFTPSTILLDIGNDILVVYHTKSD